MRGRLVPTSWESDICALAAFVKQNDLMHTGWTSCISHPVAFSKTCCTGSCQVSHWMEAPAIFLIRVSIRFFTSDTSDLLKRERLTIKNSSHTFFFMDECFVFVNSYDDYIHVLSFLLSSCVLVVLCVLAKDDGGNKQSLWPRDGID